MQRFLTRRFEIERVLRRSKYVTSFVGHDRWTDRREVFVKCIPGRVCQISAGFEKRLAWYRSIAHPRMGNVVEAGFTPGKDFYYVRDYYPASAKGFLDGADPSTIASRLVGACLLLQTHGIVHGRIKPSNVLNQDDGSLRLVDGGLPGRPVETFSVEDVRSNAPEILAGGRPSLEADLYSLGAVLYRLFARRDLFEDSNLELLKHKYLHALPVPLSELCDESRALSEIVSGLLDKEPASRLAAFPSLSDLLNVRYSAPTQAPFIGRVSEFQKALDILSVKGNRTQVVSVEGEAGIGKTRFVAELAFLHQLTAGRFLVGRCYERENRAYEPILQLVGQRLKWRDQKLDNWIRNDGGRFGPSLKRLFPDFDDVLSDVPHEDRPISAGKMVSDLAGTVISLADLSPTTIVLEDVHWIDEGSLRILEQIYFRAGESRLSLVLTLRRGMAQPAMLRFLEEPTHPGIDLHRIPLAALDDTSTFDLAQKLTDDGRRVPWITANAGGNPLFLEECARYQARNLSSLPGRVEDILLQKVGSLKSADKQVAEFLSLFPKPLPAALGKKVLASLPGQAVESLDRLIESSILCGNHDEIAFRHDGIREAIYRNLTRNRRKHYHRIVFDLLSKEGSDKEAAGYHAAGAGMTEEAARAYEHAAFGNRYLTNYRTGAELFELSRNLWTQLRKRVAPKSQIEHARCLLGVGRYRKARNLLDELLSDPVGLEPQDRSRIYTLLANLAESALESIALLQKALDSCPPTAGVSGREGLVPLAQAYAIAGKVQEAYSHLRLVERNLQETPPEPVHAVWLSAIKGNIFISLCAYKKALKVLHSGVERSDLEPIVLNNVAVCLEHVGKLSEACVHQAKVLEIVRSTGLMAAELQSLANLGAFETKSGNLQEAAKWFREAGDFCNAMNFYREGDRTNLPLLDADQAFLCMEIGEYARARRLLGSAGRMLKRDTASQKAIWVALRKCELYERTGESTLAKRAWASVRNAELFGTDFFSVERTLLASSNGKDSLNDRVGGLLDALTLTESTGTTYQRCRVLMELATNLLLIGKTDDAGKRLAEADRLSRKYGYQPLRAKILLMRGMLTSGAQKKEAYFTESYQLASEMGLREISAESAFRLGEHQLGLANLLNAREYLSRSVDTINNLATEIPLRNRNRYLNVTWRRQAISILADVDLKLPGSNVTLDNRAPDRRDDNPFFKAIYETTISLGAAATTDDCVRTLHLAIRRTLKCKVVLMLTADGKVELYPVGLDDNLSGKISRLYAKEKNQPFFGNQEVEGAAGQQNHTTAWIPLSSSGSQFGGIYVDLGQRKFREVEIEFLTMLGVIGGNALYAIIHAEQKPQRTRARTSYSGIVGRSREIEEVCAQIEIAAGSPATVLIEGESGTGKELVARAIHQNSDRRGAPFVTVDCGAIPETLIESELFGIRRGSFTGATADRAGLIESANRGTLFLDEISNTSPALQAKLLRVLQEREVRRVGDTKGRTVDIRLIAATNANLDTLVETGTFRQDLLFRLKVLHIQVPPLRSRKQDIPDIALSFLERLNETNKTKKRFGRGILDTLARGNYAGNIRELQNLIERAYFSTTVGNVIKTVEVESGARHWQSSDEVQSWFKDLTAGRKDFWTLIHARYKKRDISRENVIALMDLGLRATRGSYMSVASLFHLDRREYRRFMDFLRRNGCQPDFREYRGRGGLE